MLSRTVTDPRVSTLNLPADRRQRCSRIVRVLACWVAVVGLTACGESRMGAESPSAPTQSEGAPVSAPPGFLDPAPPMPESDTLILSGGTLVGAAVADAYPDGLFDAVVVVRDGTLIGYGRRGTVDVPADSIGIDVSGRFLEPAGAFAIDRPVNLNVYSQRPTAQPADLPLFGSYVDGRWQPANVADD